MTLDPDFRQYLDLAASAPDAAPARALTPAALRERQRRTARAFAGQPPATDLVRELTIEATGAELPARLYAPLRATEAALPGIVFFHGGGWVTGDLDTHDTLCRILCQGSGCRLVSVGYRRAPEHRFPTAILDAIGATEWVARQGNALGIDPRHLAVAGDSAGGNLAAVVAQDARDRGRILRYQLLFYPVTDTATDTPSYRENATGYGLEREDMQWFFDQYAPDPDDTRASPLRAHDLTGLAPALILTAGHDPLRDDGRAYAAALERAGSAVELRDYEDLIHGFATLAGVSQAARGATRDAAVALGRALHENASVAEPEEK